MNLPRALPALPALSLCVLLSCCSSTEALRSDGGGGLDSSDGARADLRSDQTAKAAPVYGIFQLYGDEYVEFRQKLGQSLPQYWRFVDEHVADLGVRFTRTNTLLIWGLVEPTLGAGYRWDNDQLTDAVIQAVYAPYPGKEMGFLAVIDPGRGGKGSPAFPSGLEREYQAYVRAAVARYNGSNEELGQHVAVKHWQVMNEPFWQLDSGAMTVGQYVELVKLTAAAVRQIDPQAKVVLGDVGGQLPAVVAALKDGRYFDAVDLHFWCLSEPCSYQHLPAVELRRLLDANGYSAAEIWMGEFGTFVNGSPPHSATEQARWLVKGMLANRALGVSRILWNNLVSWTKFGGLDDSPFNFMGLLTNGEASGDPVADVGTKRVAYYAYKRLIAETGSARAELLGEQDGAALGVRALLFARRPDGQRFAVAWSDQGQQLVELPCEQTDARVVDLVPDAVGSFNETIKPCVDAKVVVEVGENPLLVAPR
ncbi:MAG: hypothetical protein CSA65_01315 [Proteobacteria bacterium]|nr:MAG: hypothetical protein CSA65_01315 [Pseudomonadota bacterium]